MFYPNNDRMVNRGAGYIAARVKNAGHEVTFYDSAYCSVDEAAVGICDGKPDVLLVSASTMLFEKAKDLIGRVKSRMSIPVLVGGIHATIVRGEVLDECPEVDYICVGEGEDFIVEFMHALEFGGMESLENLGYRDSGGAVRINPVRPCTDLSALPPFRYEFFDRRSIVRAGPKPGFTYVFATRGCPYNCTYCCNGNYLELYGRDYLRKHDPGFIVDELRHLRDEYNARFFYFGDEMILFDEDYVSDLFRRVKAELDMPFGCMVRVEKITPSIVEMFRETGCCYVSMGVECGDERFRREFLNRHMSNERIVEAFRLLNTIDGMFTYAFYMHGFPVPYDAELTAKTRELNDIIKPSLVQDTAFYPLRGTKLYDYCAERGFIDFDKMKNQENYLHESVIKIAASAA